MKLMSREAGGKINNCQAQVGPMGGPIFPTRQIKRILKRVHFYIFRMRKGQKRNIKGIISLDF
jgi:hypothetical protein